MGDLIPVILSLTKRSKHGTAQCSQLQAALKTLEKEMQQKVEEIWLDVETRGKEMQTIKPAGETVGQIKRPAIPSSKWDVGILDPFVA